MRDSSRPERTHPIRTISPRPLTLTAVRVPRDGRSAAATPVLDIDGAAIAAGEIVGLLGTSGAGKTTLLDVIAGLTVPASGTVRWGDEVVSALGETRRDLWRRAHVGFVFQNVQLIPELSARDNVLLPFRFGNWRIDGAAMQRGATLLAALGLGSGSQSAGRLSRGEAQRVAVARALVAQPPLVLADEPTASLDRDNASLVGDLLLSDARRRGATLIVATHDQDLVRGFDRTMQLVAGRIGGAS
jgi:putative ABC transport system ATP-binding protein